MNYFIAAFRSRTHTLQFTQLVKKYNINCSTVNTPREAGVGCGLSMRFNESDYGRVKNILRNNNYDSFAGFFSVSHKYGRTITKVVGNY